MKKKDTTTSLMSELKEEKDIENFLSENTDAFVNKDIPGFFDEMLDKYAVSRNTAIANADIERSFGYQILKGTRFSSRDNYLRLAIGTGMNLDDTQKLMVITGFCPLYVKVKRDAVVIFGIERRLDLKAIQELLYSQNLRLL